MPPTAENQWPSGLSFASYAPHLFISAKTGRNLEKLLEKVLAVTRHAPPAGENQPA